MQEQYNEGIERLQRSILGHYFMTGKEVLGDFRGGKINSEIFYFQAKNYDVVAKLTNTMYTSGIEFKNRKTNESVYVIPRFINLHDRLLDQDPKLKLGVTTVVKTTDNIKDEHLRNIVKTLRLEYGSFFIPENGDRALSLN